MRSLTEHIVMDVKGSAVISSQQLDELTQILGLSQILDSTQMEPASRHVCPSCGWTTKQLEETGLLGCPLCYDVFREPIQAQLRPKDLVS